MSHVYVVLNTADGPAHRAVSEHRTKCGEYIARSAVSATLLACEVFGVPVCVRCFPQDSTGHPRNQPSGAR